MQSAIVCQALRLYGLPATDILPTQKGYRNESQPARLRTGALVNLIIYKAEPGMLQTIRRIHTLSHSIAREGLPVRVPIDRRILLLRSHGRPRYAAVYNYLPGETIPWEAYTQKHLKLLGKTLSDLHVALRNCQTVDMPKVTDVYLEIVDRMIRYFEQPSVRGALAGKLELHVLLSRLRPMRQLLVVCEALPGQQALHMDFVRSNVLFSPADNEFGITISGILDFEKIAIGSPLFDIVRTLAFLLVDCKYKPEAKVRKYFLISGYGKRGASGLHYQPRLLEALLDMFLFYDFYKFLRHNPYEYLPQNEHFVRTRDLLLARGVITTTTRYR